MPSRELSRRKKGSPPLSPALLGRLNNIDRSLLVWLYRWFPSVVLSENSIRLDLRGELESAHHPVRCLRSSACLGCSWPTCSSRERGLRPRRFHASRQVHGHPRPTDLAAFTVAKWLCGKSERFIASRVLGPSARVGARILSHLRRSPKEHTRGENIPRIPACGSSA
jgi:hypothetical protein